VVVDALASLAGIAAAYFLLHFLVKRMAAPSNLPHLSAVSINARVRLFGVGLCLLVTLIGLEAAFAILLLAGSGLVVRSLIRPIETNHGIRPEHVLTMRLPIGSLTQTAPAGKYHTKPRQMAYYRKLVERLRTVRGVDAVAVVNNLPPSSINTTVFIKGPDGQPMLTATRTISPDYFAVMGIARLAGRSSRRRIRPGPQLSRSSINLSRASCSRTATPSASSCLSSKGGMWPRWYAWSTIRRN
jgi:hypothetical protein